MFIYHMDCVYLNNAILHRFAPEFKYYSENFFLRKKTDFSNEKMSIMIYL
jgi:hypothetical protein